MRNLREKQSTQNKDQGENETGEMWSFFPHLRLSEGSRDITIRRHVTRTRGGGSHNGAISSPSVKYLPRGWGYRECDGGTCRVVFIAGRVSATDVYSVGYPSGPGYL